MKNAVRGLMALALGLVLSVFAFGQFSAMEQGPPGTVFQSTELNKTYPIDSTITTLVVGFAGAVGALVLITGMQSGRLRRSHLHALMNSFFLIGVRRLLAWVRKCVPVPHFTTSRWRWAV